MKSKEQILEQQKLQLFKLLAWVGSQQRLANELGTTRQAVNNWIARGRISATCATLVERKTAGLFKRSDLRPDVVNWNEEI